jgi:hypothetical protein
MPPVAAVHTTSRARGNGPGECRSTGAFSISRRKREYPGFQAGVVTRICAMSMPRCGSMSELAPDQDSEAMVARTLCGNLGRVAGLFGRSDFGNAQQHSGGIRPVASLEFLRSTHFDPRLEGPDQSPCTGRQCGPSRRRRLAGAQLTGVGYIVPDRGGHRRPRCREKLKWRRRSAASWRSCSCSC